MFKKDNIENIKKSVIDMMISNKRDIEDKYIIDDENAIIVVHGDEPTGYVMIHKKLVGGKLVEINKWPVVSYYFGSIHNITVIPDLKLFQVQNGAGGFNAIYNYKEGKFIVPQKIWGQVDSGRENNFLKKYNGFLATFEIQSDYEKDDVYAYNNPITGEKIIESFAIKERYYYAILNIDGTIRGNKLFKGDSFSKITEIIDLDNYESIVEFKNERKKICNDRKQKEKNAYYQMLKTRNDGSISPYLDSEVEKILKIELK